jgi:hypothetical protein
MVTTWRSDVHLLVRMCRVCIESRIQFSASQRYFSWYSLLPWYIPRLNPSKSLATHLTSHPIISHIISVAEIPAVSNIIINWWTCDLCSFHVCNGSSVAETCRKIDTKLVTPVLRDDAVLTGMQICFLAGYFVVSHNTGRFIMFSVITNIYNKKTKGPTSI